MPHTHIYSHVYNIIFISVISLFNVILNFLKKNINLPIQEKISYCQFYTRC